VQTTFADFVLEALLHKAGPPGCSPRGVTASQGAKTRYKATNWNAHTAAREARGSPTAWLGKDSARHAPGMSASAAVACFAVEAGALPQSINQEKGASEI